MAMFTGARAANLLHLETGQANFQKRRLFLLSRQQRVRHLNRETDLAGLNRLGNSQTDYDDSGCQESNDFHDDLQINRTASSQGSKLPMTRSMRGEIGSRVVSRTSGFCKKFVSLKQQQADPAVATPYNSIFSNYQQSEILLTHC